MYIQVTFGVKKNSLLIVLLLLLIGILGFVYWTEQARSFEKYMRMKLSSQMVKMKRWPDYVADVEFDQPWSLPIVSVVENVEHLKIAENRYLFIDFYLSPGLGNEMFQYASLMAAARDYNAKVLMPVSCNLRRAFNLDAVFITNKIAAQLLHIFGPLSRKELGCCTYRGNLFKDLFANGTNFHLFEGYLQAFNYFNHQSAAVRDAFTFLPEIQEMAKTEFTLAKNQRLTNLTDTTSDRFTVVGIHIRHGRDIVDISSNYLHGHTSATPQYYQNAMSYFRKKYGTVLFIVASDDIHWAKLNLLPNEKGEIYFLPSKYREVDFAVLTMCEHTIASTGTFSWWISYLTGGEVVYYSNWPRKGSAMATFVKKSDFFPPTWIPMI